MSDQTSISCESPFPWVTDGNEYVVNQLALSKMIRASSGSSWIKQCANGNETIYWTRLMEWFVEAVIGIEAFRKEHPSAPPLTFEDIRMDTSATILITPPSSPQNRSRSGSLSTDLKMLCTCFQYLCRTLTDQNRLILPLNPEQKEIVFSRIMVALVEHFVASGDLILPNSSPQDHSQYFSEWFHLLGRSDDRSQDPFLIHNLSTLFALSVLQSSPQNVFIPAKHSFLCGDEVESSEQLFDAVKKIKETHSIDIAWNAYYDWAEWEMMLWELKTDTSFLQSRCLRSTLLSLQTKHQLIANTHQTKENKENVLLPSEIRPSNPHLPFDPDVSSNWMEMMSSQYFSISTQTALPSHPTSSSSRLLPSVQSVDQPELTKHRSQHLLSEYLMFRADSVVHRSRQILSAIHLLLTRPPPPPFPWDVRPSVRSERHNDALFKPSPRFVDNKEKFDTSLFFEADDVKLVTSLRRCRAVVEETHSAECIVDVVAFRTLLIAGLHSTNLAVQFECYSLFFLLSSFLHIVDDPRGREFQNLHSAFRDGTLFEQLALLRLWNSWLNHLNTRGQKMRESDFDFSGFLAADLSDTSIFDEACLFVWLVLRSNAISMSRSRRLDFVLKFERRHRMMSRLSGDPNRFSEHERPKHFLSPFAALLGSFLSVYRGCRFPSSLTDMLARSCQIHHHMSPPNVNPAFFLNHTSIAPKYRHSFYPMDLIFERCLRSDPDAFFRSSPDVSECTSRLFLDAPSVGLHSLLLRGVRLNLDLPALRRLLSMFFVEVNRDFTFSQVYVLFGFCPVPRLLDTLLASPHLVRADGGTWNGFLTVFSNISAYAALFGACSSLAAVFKMLIPFDSNPNEIELDLLRKSADEIVMLHWLNIPARFDSPLICHLPSLANAQRGVLQTLSSYSGIPSLAATFTLQYLSDIMSRLDFQDVALHRAITSLSLSVRVVSSDARHSSLSKFALFVVRYNALISSHPTIVSAAVETILRFVSVLSDADCVELVKQGALDRIVFAVSNSSFLDDYEKGVAVVGMLLAAIRRDDQKQKILQVDFTPLF
ncbi:hypothetical protein BLNAU_14424 [Blattamonas nauphoetae]|uniref:Uncharacterized protein n=1 Tax=Blattamonas nauphoetae TaxID=2049346 RepID=A0ABQ9XDQ3_9EUKA|nr:hypothetical protein BLNAU_14424 [Blattamonas nauphoetae]